MIVSVCVGIHIGAWTNYQLGQMTESSLPPPYTIIWPNYEMLGEVLDLLNKINYLSFPFLLNKNLVAQGNFKSNSIYPLHLR